MPNATNESLTELARRFQAGEISQTEFIESSVRQATQSWVLAYRILGDWCLAEDAQQEALLNFVLAVRKGTVIRNPRSFIARCVINRALSMLTVRRRETPLEVDVRVDPLTPEDLAYYQEVRAQLAGLGPRAEAILLAVADDGLSAREAAVALGETYGAVRGQYFQARQRLKEQLKSGTRTEPRQRVPRSNRRIVS